MQLVHGYACMGSHDTDMVLVPEALYRERAALVRMLVLRQTMLVREMWNPNEARAPTDPARYDEVASILERWQEVYQLVASGELRLFHNIPHDDVVPRGGGRPRRGRCGRLRVHRSRNHLLEELLLPPR